MMNESNQNNMTSFKSNGDAFEFLVQQSQNQILKERWRIELEELKIPHQATGHYFKEGIFKKLVGIAIVLISLLCLYYWFYGNRNSLDYMANNMLEESYFAVATDSYTRGVADLNEKPLLVDLQKEINIALEQNDFEAAIGLFLTKEKQAQLSLEDKFYYALSISKIDKGDYYKAIRLLENVETYNGKFYNESLWLQGLLHIKTGNPNNSKVILKKLIYNSDYQYNNVKYILYKIDETR